MATRRILTEDEPGLYKRCREITAFDQRLHTLLDDMRETLSQAEGLGLAAPQVGVLRRAAVVLETHVDEGEEPYMIELINPELIYCAGEQCGAEGCLSAPGRFGLVSRPMDVTVRAMDRNGEAFEVSGTGITARCFCHEIDHLNGRMFTSMAERMLTQEELESGEFSGDGD